MQGQYYHRRIPPTKRTAIYFVSGLIALLITSVAGSAEKTIIPAFKNVDEAIGWVKAKGSCEKIGKDQQGQRCRIKIDLPDDKIPNSKGDSVWKVWTWIETFDLHTLRHFRVAIIRSRYFSLSGKDNSVRSVKTSTYFFGRDGKINEVSVASTLENMNGETITNQEIPLSREYAHKHGEGASDMLILKHQLGIGWDY